MATSKSPLPDSGSLPGTHLDTIGSVQTNYTGHDAVHIATVSCFSTERLTPGQQIGRVPNDPHKVSANVENFIGIVDPFLSIPFIPPGTWFLMLLYPRTITSLRHEWTHPAFPSSPAPSKAEIEAQIRALIEDHCDVSYHQFMTQIEAGDYSSNSMTIYGEDASGSIPTEIWPLLEAYYDRPFNKRPEYFSCSC